MLALPDGGFVGRFTVEQPKIKTQGDYATNVAMLLANGSTGLPQVRKSPLVIAQALARQLEKNTKLFTKVEAVAPGFVNFFLTKETFTEEVAKIDEKYGKANVLEGKKIIIEYTDPNPFKEFHIGHFMSNAIGEVISRLLEWQGAEVKRACYQGDVGLHVAKALYGLSAKPTNSPDDFFSNDIKVVMPMLAKAYAYGSKAYEEDSDAKADINKINNNIYNNPDPLVDEIYKKYKWGREKSLEYFESIYKKLGTHFDFYFFESESGPFGKKIVEEGLEKGIFEKSDGATVFRGEEHGLHTRVFVNSQGLPTYEAKELGIAKIKYNKYPYDQSIVVTGNEVNGYFRVVIKAMEKVFPDLAKKTVHLSHGMLRLPSGKMSSRTGDVITAELLIKQAEGVVLKKINESNREIKDKEKLTEEVAIAAIKYGMLRQAPGRDAVFDVEKATSFEGDSGPYLQYSFARASSVLEKAKKENIKANILNGGGGIYDLEKTLVLFPEVVLRAGQEYAPQHFITYLTELASSFNAHYAKYVIVDPLNKESSYQVALTRAFVTIMKNGLSILGMATPEKM